MKNLYMLQVNYAYGRSAHLPYAAGVLTAYAMQDENIRREYVCKKIFYLREKPENILEKLVDPAVIGFSTYLWNFQFNLHIAKEVKKRYPECVILFGGHHVTPGDGLLLEYPFIDYLIHSEGEEAFKRLLLCGLGLDTPQNIPGISYRTERGAVTNPVKMITEEWITIPSPYLSGCFDEIIKEAPDREFLAVIETSRGCPNSCAYCDWSNMRSRIRKMPMEQIKAEIQWVAEHRICVLGAADSNFGIFERDEKITDYLIKIYQKYGYPKRFQTSYAKNSNERIFNIGCKLEKYHLSKGITLSFQSMDETVLENIGRKNIPVEHYKELMSLYNAAGISTYTELILGLPGETPESFCKGIDSLLKMGQHNSIYIHNCEWLPCSYMGTPEYTEKFKIKTALIPLNQPHIEQEEEDGIREYSRLVISTCSMTPQDWIQMNLFSFTVQCFHHMGLLQLFALYLYQEQGISYRVFYQKLLDWLLTAQNRAGEALRFIKSQLIKIAKGQNDTPFVVCDERFGKVKWSFEEYMYLCTIADKDAFYEDVKEFLSKFITGEPLFSLLAFQNQMIKVPFTRKKTVHTNYNFNEYFVQALKNKKLPLVTGAYTHQIQTAYYDSWESYAKEVVWYGRKDSRNIDLSEQ